MVGTWRHTDPQENLLHHARKTTMNKNHSNSQWIGMFSLAKISHPRYDLTNMREWVIIGEGIYWSLRILPLFDSKPICSKLAVLVLDPVPWRVSCTFSPFYGMASLQVAISDFIDFIELCKHVWNAKNFNISWPIVALKLQQNISYKNDNYQTSAQPDLLAATEITTESFFMICHIELVVWGTILVSTAWRPWEWELAPEFNLFSEKSSLTLNCLVNILQGDIITKYYTLILDLL